MATFELNYEVQINETIDQLNLNKDDAVVNIPQSNIIKHANEHKNGSMSVRIDDDERLRLKNDLPKTDKILLHSCCAPCSGSMIKELIDLGIDVTILWYNPNIQPKQEYEIRKEENLKYALKLGIGFVDLDYDVKEWYARVVGMEFEPERGPRCTECFDMRMERTALYAIENGFTYFSTTNATSRWKDVVQVNDSGRKAATRYLDKDNQQLLHFWEYNWQTDRMTQVRYGMVRYGAVRHGRQKEGLL